MLLSTTYEPTGLSVFDQHITPSLLNDNKETIIDCNDPNFKNTCGTNNETPRMYAACRNWESQCQGQAYKSIDDSQIKQSVIKEPEDDTKVPDDTPDVDTNTNNNNNTSGSKKHNNTATIVLSIIGFVLLGLIIIITLAAGIKQSRKMKEYRAVPEYERGIEMT